MKNIITNLQDRYKTFLFIFAIAISAVLLVMFGKDNKSAVFLSIIIGGMLLIGKPLWFSSRHGDTMVRMTSLLIASSAVAAFVGWRVFFEDIVKSIMKDNYPSFAVQNQEIIAALIFFFLSVVIYIVNRSINGDNTGMGVHPRDIDKDIPEPTFQDRLYAVCEALTDDLKIIDNKTNWSTHHFTPLDAEVEVNTKNGSDRKVTDLLKAIKNSKKRLFLVLGSPGSGKSVALRKLCQDLASEVKSTGKIPIYVNLREWQIESEWSTNNPPSIEELTGFVKNNIMNRDIVTTKFFKKYFDKLYETGRLYFVFDSFDEIPAVLNERENSELIRILSSVIFKFLKGARQESQGILASRMFRKPTVEFQTEVTLEIRPFTEEKIVQTFRNTGSFNDNLIKCLFKERPELVPIARNPFSAVLIAEFADECDGALPPNQSEMYASYINQTLNTCKDRIDRKHLTKELVINYTLEIASIMFRKYGLEASVTNLSEDLPSVPVEDVIDILKFARLGRAGSGDDNIFSFSHRRFTEYFTIQKLINDNEEIEYQAIPKDSQWRDALVLYCEVVDKDRAKNIANYCWKIIKDQHTDESHMIHSLRFLRDAFRGRTECVEDFREDLANYINQKINDKNDVLSIKLMIETLPLLEEKNIRINILKGLSLENKIINDCSINIYRNLSTVSTVLSNKATDLINKKDLFDLIKERKELLFSLSLSRGFEKAHNAIYKRTSSFYLLILTLVLLSVIAPFLVPVAICISSVFIVANYILNKVIITDDITNRDNILNRYNITSKYNIISGSINYKHIIIISFVFTYFLLANVSQVDIYLKENIDIDIDYMDRNSYCKETKCYLLEDYIPINNNIPSDTDCNNSFFLNKIDLSSMGEFESILSILALCLMIYSMRNIFFIKISYYGILKVVLILVIPYLVLTSKSFVIIMYKYEAFMISFSIILSLFSLIHVIYLSVSMYYKNNNILKNIEWKNLNKRKNIHKYFADPQLNEKIRVEIIRYLENNIKNASGEWPDKKIFTVTKRSESYIRLAKLEQKWCESK